MKIAKRKGSKIYHLVTEDAPTDESPCGQFFLQDPQFGDTVAETTAEAARELVQAGTFCKRCAKRLEACFNPPPTDIWRVELEKAIQEGVTLNWWNDFFQCSGAITFHPDPDFELSGTYLKALFKTYRYLIENEESILVSMLTRFLPIYEDWRQNLDFGHSDEEKLTVMPPVADIRQFAELLRPECIIVDWRKKRGVFCLDYEFNALWYEGHGFCVRMWCDKPEEFGE